MDESGIYARESAYLDRYVQVGVAGEKVISLSFPVHPEDGNGDHPLCSRIDAYLEGAADDFRDVSVGLTVPTTHRAILEATREIPYGEGATVEQVARMTPELDATDGEDLTTVREILDENPVPLVVPDHRVRDGPSAAPPTVEQKLRAIEEL